MQTKRETVDYAKLFMDLPTPHIMIRNDKALTIVGQNAAHIKLTDTKPGYASGKALLEVFPDTSEKYRKTGFSDLAESIRKVGRTGKADSLPLLNYNIKNKDGKFVERWWRATHYPIFDDNNNVAFIYQVTEDVTEEVSMDHKHDLTQSLFDSILEVGLVSTWSWDIKRDIVLGDSNLFKRFGVNQRAALSGELPLEAFVNSIHIDDRERVSKSISNIVSSTSKKSFNEEYRTIDADKKISWVIARGKVDRDSKGNPTFLNGILINITDQKKAQAKLEETERRFNALFNSKIVAIAIANVDGLVTQANNTFLTLFGYTKTDIKNGLSSEQVSFIENDPGTQNIYKTIRQTGQSQSVHKEYKRKDGSHFTGLVGAAMLPGSQDEFIAFIIDITENEKLKELNTVKDEFIAMASHQLRTPATTVKQYLGVLMDEYAGALNESQLQYANIANNANNRQLAIIEDLLKTAKLDIEGYVLNLKPTNLVKIVQSVVNDYEPSLDSKDQKLVVSKEKEVIIIRTDETELSICIANLIENASKYSAPGNTIKINVSSLPGTAIVAISDKGVGIDPKDYPKIFDKFTRVDNPLSDTVSGSGLGLYWVKRIVELHKGDLQIKSKLGKGTTISIRLPI